MGQTMSVKETPKPPAEAKQSADDKKKANDKQKGDKAKPTDGKAEPTDGKDKKPNASGDSGAQPPKEMTEDEAREQLKTVPYDPRFPNQNQTRNCYQNYLDYHRCLKVKNDEGFCEYYKWAYGELCPHKWTDKWDTQRETGLFPGRI